MLYTLNTFSKQILQKEKHKNLYYFSFFFVVTCCKNNISSTKRKKKEVQTLVLYIEVDSKAFCIFFCIVYCNFYYYYRNELTFIFIFQNRWLITSIEDKKVHFCISNWGHLLKFCLFIIYVIKNSLRSINTVKKYLFKKIRLHFSKSSRRREIISK